MVRYIAPAALWIDPSQRAGPLPTEQPPEAVPHQRRVLASLMKQDSSNGWLHQPMSIPLGRLFDQHPHGAMKILT